MGDERDFDPTTPAEEPEELILLTERLLRERPLPAAGFRRDLRRQLLAPHRRRAAPAAGHRRWSITSVSLGAACLAIVAIGLVGTGPFAA